MATFDYGYWEGYPTVFTDREAWLYTDQWRRWDHADAFTKAGLMSKDEFKKTWPQLPPLPAIAFQDESNRDAALP